MSDFNVSIHIFIYCMISACRFGTLSFIGKLSRKKVSINDTERKYMLRGWCIIMDVSCRIITSIYFVVVFIYIFKHFTLYNSKILIIASIGQEMLFTWLIHTMKVFFSCVNRLFCFICGEYNLAYERVGQTSLFVDNIYI